jgi:hypothetical protein
VVVVTVNGLAAEAATYLERMCIGGTMAESMVHESIVEQICRNFFCVICSSEKS